jgi:hypothetical protein
MKSGSFMRILPLLKSEVIYARDIVKAGLDAAASAGKMVSGEEPKSNLARLGRSALAPAALGAAIGILGVYLGRKERLGHTALLGGLVGCALGFTSGVAWGTRAQARVCCLTAAHNVQSVRDAHWLEKNPIAYA